MKLRIIIIFIAFLVTNCGTLRFSKYDTFGDWFFGEPGYRGAYLGYEPTDEKKLNQTYGSFIDPRLCIVFPPIILLIPPIYHTARAFGSYHDPEESEEMYCSKMINETRHPWYLSFRTPELIFNPQGGIYFPETQEREFSKKQKKCIAIQTFERGQEGTFDIEHYFMNTGIIDAAIPYRVWMLEEPDVSEKIAFTIFSPIFLLPINRAVDFPFFYQVIIYY